MDENAVVDAVCRRLEAMGCTITQRCSTTQRGVDVEARHRDSGERYYVEAKGGTSSQKGSKRFGREYDASQVFDVVAKGVFACLRLGATYPDRQEAHVVLAVPDGDRFPKYLTMPVIRLLFDAGIEVWLESPSVTQSAEPV